MSADATVSPSPEPNPALDATTLPGERRKRAGKGVVRRQIRGSSLLLAGRLLSRGVNFCVQVLIVRYLTKSDFGAFAYALSMVALAQHVSLLGLSKAAARFVPLYQEREDYGAMFGTIVTALASVCAIGAAIVAWSGAWQGASAVVLVCAAVCAGCAMLLRRTGPRGQSV